MKGFAQEDNKLTSINIYEHPLTSSNIYQHPLNITIHQQYQPFGAHVHILARPRCSGGSGSDLVLLYQCPPDVRVYDSWWTHDSSYSMRYLWGIYEVYMRYLWGIYEVYMRYMKYMQFGSEISLIQTTWSDDLMLFGSCHNYLLLSGTCQDGASTKSTKSRVSF